MTRSLPNLAGAAIPEALKGAEAAVLGGIILKPELLRDLDLEVDSFAHLPHRVVFAAMRALEASDRAIDTTTLEVEVARGGRLDAIGGPAFFGTLALHVPIADNVHEYAKVIADAHVKRKVRDAAIEIVERSTSPALSGDELLTEATTRLAAIDGHKAETVASIGELAERRIADVDRFAREAREGRRALSGAPTGVAALDAKTGGWQFGIVNLLAARPGMGKSSLALATADACSLGGFGVHVFSLEDSWHAYTDRQLARISGVPAVRIRRADLDAEDTRALVMASRELKSRKGWLVDERGGLTVQELVRAMRRHQPKNGTRLAVCDYIQLLKKRDPRMQDFEHLGECMQALAESAKVDDVAWVVLSQFNRKLEDRVDKRPQLSDLRGSGELEEKCKLAVALYRGSYYGGRPKRDVDYECECPESARSCAHAPSASEWEEQVQVLILKGGNGPTGRVMASWNGELTKIW